MRPGETLLDDGVCAGRSGCGTGDGLETGSPGSLSCARAHSASSGSTSA